MILLSLILAVLSGSPSQAKPCSQPVEEWIRAHAHLPPEIKNLVPMLEEELGQELFLTRHGRHRDFAMDGSTAIFEFSDSDRNSFRFGIRVVEKNSPPRFAEDRAKRLVTFDVPLGWGPQDQADRELIRRALRGVAIHPYDPHSLRGFTRKQVQQDAVKAYEYAEKKGAREFMVVGPPGVGKTLVLEDILRKRLEKLREARAVNPRRRGKVIFFTTDRIDPVHNFANKLRASGTEIVEWGGNAEKADWQSILDKLEKGEDVVLVSVLQSMKIHVGAYEGMEDVLQKYASSIDSIFFDEVQRIGGRQTQPFMMNLRGKGSRVPNEHRPFFVGGTCVPRSSSEDVELQEIFKRNQFWMFTEDYDAFRENHSLPFLPRPYSYALEQYNRADWAGEIYGVQNAIRMGQTVPSSKGPVPVHFKLPSGRMDINPEAYASIGVSVAPIAREHKHVFIRVPSQSSANELAEHIAKDPQRWGVQGPVYTFHSDTPLEEQEKVRELFKSGKPGTILLVDRTEALDFPEASLAIDLTLDTDPWAFLNFLGRITRISQGKAPPTLITFGQFKSGTLKERLDIMQFLENRSLPPDDPRARVLPAMTIRPPGVRQGQDREAYLQKLKEVSRKRLQKEIDLVKYHVWRQNLPEFQRQAVNDTRLRQFEALDAHLVALDIAHNHHLNFPINGDRVITLKSFRTKKKWQMSPLLSVDHPRYQKATRYRAISETFHGPKTELALNTQAYMEAGVLEANFEDVHRLFPDEDYDVQGAIAIEWTRDRLSKTTTPQDMEHFLSGDAILPPSILERIRLYNTQAILTDGHLAAIEEHPENLSHWSKSPVLEAALAAQGGKLPEKYRKTLTESLAREIESTARKSKLRNRAKLTIPYEEVNRNFKKAFEIRKQKNKDWFPREIEAIFPDLKEHFPDLEDGLRDQDAWKILNQLSTKSRDLWAEWVVAYVLRCMGLTRQDLLVNKYTSFAAFGPYEGTWTERLRITFNIPPTALELDPPEISPNLQRGIASLQTTYNEELIPWADGLVPGWNFSDLRTYYQVHRALPDFFLYKLNHRHTERILELLRIDAEWPKERP